MDVEQNNGRKIWFISTPELEPSQRKDLLKIKYTRVQKEAPNFASLYEGIDQNVDIKMSTLVFRAEPEPVIALYDFIMTTFVPESDIALDQSAIAPHEAGVNVQDTEINNDGKIRVLLKFEGVQGASGFLLYLCKTLTLAQ